MTRPGSRAPPPQHGEKWESPTGQPSASGAPRLGRCALWVAAAARIQRLARVEGRARVRARGAPGPLGPQRSRSPDEAGSCPRGGAEGSGRSAAEGAAGAAAPRRAGAARALGQGLPDRSAGDTERARSTNLLEAAVPPRPTRAPGTEALARLSLPSSSLLRRDAPSCRA